jgi:hypothetical protein
MKQLRPVGDFKPVGDFTLVATDAAVGKRIQAHTIESGVEPGSKIKNATDCARVARNDGYVVAMYQEPIYQTGGYGKSGDKMVRVATPGYCLAFKTNEGLSLVAGATPGQTVMAQMGSVPSVTVKK